MWKVSELDIFTCSNNWNKQDESEWERIGWEI